MLHELRKAHGFEKLGTFLRSLRSWKEYANLSQHGQNGGESARKTVKTESRDEPCPISVIGGASCPVSELRDQIYTPQELRDKSILFSIINRGNTKVILKSHRWHGMEEKQIKMR